MRRIAESLALEEPVEAYVTGAVVSWEMRQDEYIVFLSDATLDRTEECIVRIPKVNQFGITEREIRAADEANKLCAVYGSSTWDGSRLEIKPSALGFYS